MGKTKQRSSKPASKSTSSSFSPSSVTSPFTSAPHAFKSFLAALPTDRIYIFSLDAHDSTFKRRVYAVSLILNIFIAAILLYRLQQAVPVYTSIFLAILGYDSPARVDTRKMDARAVRGLLGGRALMFIADFILFRFLIMWPWGFFLGFKGEASPVKWRRRVGFRDNEVVVRRSRRWDATIFMKDNGSEERREAVSEQWLEGGLEGEICQRRIVPAVEKNYVKNKTSYLMLDMDWDLYFTGMINAHALIDEGTNKMEDFRTQVLVFSEHSGWLSWEVWREHEHAVENEGSSKLQLVKDHLTRMGKENLFFRWIEVVQSETSQPGPFTREKQQKAALKVREEFEQQGVDYDTFWEKVGGLENMPGMEIRG